MKGRGARKSLRWLAASVVTAMAMPVAAAPVAPALNVRLLPDNTPDAAEQAAVGRKPGDPPWKLTALATFDALSNTSGGLARGTRLLDKLSVAVAYSAGSGWSGLASLQYTNGTPFSGTLVGDTQTASNIEAVGSVRIYEAWVAHSIPLGRIKLGLTDLNADFDVQQAGGLFLNSSDGIAAEFSHTGRNGPSIFPTTALAATAYVEPAEGWRLDLGIFDGVPGDPAHPRRFAIKINGDSGALIVGQATWRRDDHFRVEAGAWTYTAPFDALDQFDVNGKPQRLRSSRGAYGLIEGHLYDPDGPRALTGWVRAGLADDRVNRIAAYAGGGLVYAAPIKGRDSDTAGLSVMRAMFGDPARRAEPGLAAAETTIEATYRAAVMPRVALQPDVQYIVHPGSAPGIANALVVGLRLTLGASYAPIPTGRRLTSAPH